jgi:hypothetical protein
MVKCEQSAAPEQQPRPVSNAPSNGWQAVSRKKNQRFMHFLTSFFIIILYFRRQIIHF